MTPLSLLMLPLLPMEKKLEKQQMKNILRGVPYGISMLDIHKYDSRVKIFLFFNSTNFYIEHLVRIKPEIFKTIHLDKLIKKLKAEHGSKFGKENTLSNGFSPWNFGFGSPTHLKLINEEWEIPWLKSKEELQKEIYEGL
jgi:hypothetical protein